MKRVMLIAIVSLLTISSAATLFFWEKSRNIVEIQYGTPESLYESCSKNISHFGVSQMVPCLSDSAKNKLMFSFIMLIGIEKASQKDGDLNVSERNKKIEDILEKYVRSKTQSTNKEKISDQEIMDFIKEISPYYETDDVGGDEVEIHLSEIRTAENMAYATEIHRRKGVVIKEAKITFVKSGAKWLIDDWDNLR